MEPVFYTVQNINGDYAYMVSDTGADNQTAMFCCRRAWTWGAD